MASSNDAQKPGKKLNGAAAQKLREQLANKIAELSDDELSQVAGGTDTTVIIEVSLATLGLATTAIPFDGSPSSPNAVSPGQVLNTAG
jgi:bacteriocin-like protein